MSSSSIEVMSGNDVDMVLMETSDKNGKMEIHTLEAADPLSSFIMQDQEEGEEEHELNLGEKEDLENLTPVDPLDPSPGSIIFSPQDMLASSKLGRTRGRGRAKGVRRADALTIKIEEGVDYSKIIVPVACEICGKIVANGKNLVQHMTTHSDIKPYQCPHCMKSFARMVHLQGHLVLHGIEKQFECPVCHQRFSRQDCVKVHMRLHDKSKCVFCEVCHKAFLTIGALNIHMRIHRGEKPFKCHLCGKCFTQKNHVITHIKRHTKISDAPYSKKLGPRMFQCEHCPRSFIRLSDYERHVQWNHGAVADTATISDKLPFIDDTLTDLKSNLDSNLSSLIGTTLNSKVKKKSIRKVMCTIGTQTDEEGGHVIVPRQYQSASSMIETSTQVSAPPTPRPTDEDMYENDIFDEGMDRNFSSDEEEYELNPNQEPVTYQESETTTYTQSETGDSTKDDAFDAVLGKPKPEPSKIEEKISEKSQNEESSDEAENAIESDREIHSELGTEYSKREEIETELDSDKSKGKKVECSNKNLDSKSSEKQIPSERLQQTSTEENKSASKPIEQIKTQSNPPHKFAVPQIPKTPRIVENFNTKNWKGRLGAPRAGRGRGRGKNKNIMGLTGATHLRLIRKSMINFISEKTEQMNTEQMNTAEKNNENISEEQFENSEPSDKRAKRQSKSKQHGKDFVCSIKTCETCNPGTQNSYSSKEIVIENDETTQPTPSGPVSKDQSQKLLQFLLSGDESNLQGTDFKLINDVKEIQMESKRFKIDEVSSFKTPVEYENSKIIKGHYNTDDTKLDKTDYFIPVSKTGEYVSPPVELQAFCIPTYSCKLCGREFRFEGKLHRHIESVHQNKPIFSPDVKPGRGIKGDIERELLHFHTQVEKSLEQPILKKLTPRNPEIEALRSEWDDDDDDGEEEDSNMNEGDNSLSDEMKISPVQQNSSPITFNALMKRSHQYTRPFITKDFVSVTDTLTDSYASGVKVNINKISGLAGPDSFELSKRTYGIPSTSTKEILDKKEIMVHTLDTKCRKLLEKLFDHSLLIDCGLFKEHVSVVLGRILQHYGVKMIEDYGQGQYEVLKYNLWRLIEWKVTMEQMEEFYTEGKSVEEMMDDIMNGRVPIIAHHEPQAEQQQHQQPTQMQTQSQQQQQQGENSQSLNDNNQIQTVEAVQITDNQLVLSQVANVLGGQLNLGEGVTQVVLAQDVSPEMLQGAHIVTIDPTTGQVLSQVTADQVILTDSLTEDMNQIHSIDNSQVTPHTSSVVSSLPPGSIVAANSIAAQQANVVTTIGSDQIVNTGGTIIKIETSAHSS